MSYVELRQYGAINSILDFFLNRPRRVAKSRLGNLEALTQNYCYREYEEKFRNGSIKAGDEICVPYIFEQEDHRDLIGWNYFTVVDKDSLCMPGVRFRHRPKKFLKQTHWYHKPGKP